MSFYEHWMVRNFDRLRGHIVLIEAAAGTIISLLLSIIVLLAISL